jgi:hypothetical protein
MGVAQVQRSKKSRLWSNVGVMKRRAIVLFITCLRVMPDLVRLWTENGGRLYMQV